MQRPRILALALSGFLLLLSGVRPGEAAFKDPLLTPAMSTDRAALAPMTTVAHAGPLRLVAAGWRGLIAWSDDRGATWRQAMVPVREDLTALAFPTATHGWAVGNEGLLLETVDGGKSWVKRLDGNIAARLMVSKYEPLAARHPEDKLLDAALREAKGYLAQAPARPFLDVAFKDEQTGYIVGTFNMVFRTTDGGRSWEPLFEKTDNPNAYNIYSVRLIGDQVYLVGELGLALRLDPASGRFVQMPVPYQGSLFVAVGDARSLVVAGLRGNAFRSDDQGRSWTRIDFATLAPTTFTGASLSADGNLVLVTVSGQILTSADGGRSFRAAHPRDGMLYAGVAPAGSDTVVVVGTSGIRTESIR